MSRTYTCRIDERHLPKGAKSCIEWALNQWAKASNGRLQFLLSYGSPDIMFSGAETPAGKVAWCQPLGNGAFHITFDTRRKWATTWAQRTFLNRSDFRKFALHEIGHVVFGNDHSDNPESIMYYAPKWAEIDEETRIKLTHL